MVNSECNAKMLRDDKSMGLARDVKNTIADRSGRTCSSWYDTCFRRRQIQGRDDEQDRETGDDWVDMDPTRYLTTCTLDGNILGTLWLTSDKLRKEVEESVNCMYSSTGSKIVFPNTGKQLRTSSRWRISERSERDEECSHT